MTIIENLFKENRKLTKEPKRKGFKESAQASEEYHEDDIYSISFNCNVYGDLSEVEKAAEDGLSWKSRIYKYTKYVPNSLKVEPIRSQVYAGEDETNCDIYLKVSSYTDDQDDAVDTILNIISLKAFYDIKNIVIELDEEILYDSTVLEESSLKESYSYDEMLDDFKAVVNKWADYLGDKDQIYKVIDTCCEGMYESIKEDTVRMNEKFDQSDMDRVGGKEGVREYVSKLLSKESDMDEATLIALFAEEYNLTDTESEDMLEYYGIFKEYFKESEVDRLVNYYRDHYGPELDDEDLDEVWEEIYNDYEDESLANDVVNRLEGFPEECLKEDTVKKKNGKWTNRGDDGTEHGEFDTKKEADAQRRAMYANEGLVLDIKKGTK